MKSEMWMGKEAVLALEGLEEAGFEAWLVGGCVRDHLLGRIPGDVDIATAARPEQVETLFAKFPVLLTGARHGTVKVRIHGVWLEITTYRMDGAYTDHRRPERVEFTSELKEDLARRDFTINAMAYSLRRGLVDPFGGRVDLDKGLLRCVGVAKQRFCEDALRIVRCLRFAATLGFEIEKETAQAAFLQKELLQRISAERLWSELGKLIVGKNGASVVCSYIDIIGVFVPELLPAKGFLQNNPHHAYDVLTHCALTMGKAELPEHKEEKEHRYLCLKAAALFHDIGKPLTYREDCCGVGHFYGHAKESARVTGDILRRLKVDAVSQERILRLVQYHHLPLRSQEKMLLRWMNRLTPELLDDLISLQQADCLARKGDLCGQADCLARKGDLCGQEESLGEWETWECQVEELEQVRALMQRLLAENQCFSLRGLELDGNDLLRCGVKQGPQIGKLLSEALRGVIDGKVANQRDEILAYLLDINKNKK